MQNNGEKRRPSQTLQEMIQEEERKMRRLRIMVDLTAAVLAQEKLSIDEALDMMNATRRAVLRLFPGKESTYDIIYGKRFERILKARFADGGIETPHDKNGKAGEADTGDD